LTTRVPRFLTTVIATAAVTMSVAACGGGTSQTAVRSAFVTQANQLCKQFADDYNSAKAKLPVPPSNDDLVLLAQGTYAPDAIQTYQQISALKMPTADEQDLKSLMDQSVAEVQLIQSDPLKGGSKLNQRDIVRRMRSYGLTDCGVGFDRDVDHDEFVKEADSICVNLAAKIDQIRTDNNIDGATPDARAAAVRNNIVPVYLDALSQIESIGYPDADKDFLTKLIADSRVLVESFVQDPAGFFDPSRPGEADIHQRWQSYGSICT